MTETEFNTIQDLKDAGLYANDILLALEDLLDVDMLTPLVAKIAEIYSLTE